MTVSFDNLGEVTDLQRGLWPRDAPLGRHFSVTRVLPRILAALADVGLRATFFVEGRNAELYPDTLTALAAAGHEVAYHGWCHERWAELSPAREAELLDQGVRAMDGLGLRPRGFRPPGGRLTPSSLRLLRDLGFTHCSPAGHGVGVRDGVVILPFQWPVIDAYHYLPRFGELRERDRGSRAPLSPADFEAALERALGAAVAERRHLSVLFHPFLAERDDRLAVLRRHLDALRGLVDDGIVWCAPYREVADWLRGGPRAETGTPPDELRLDPTAA